MLCSKCNTMNDPDARFCTDCGTPIIRESKTSPARGRKVYFYALLLIPIIALAVGAGYYKYILPSGVAAVVNGEEIMASELDDALLRFQGTLDKADSRLRYQVLHGLITELLVLQQARKAGVAVSREELASAVAQAKAASGLDEAAFNQQVEGRYGSMQNFEKKVASSLLTNKFIGEKIVPPDADQKTADAVVNRWMQDLSARAAVRITLAEQLSAAACGCCGNRAEASGLPARSGGCRMANKGLSPGGASSDTGKATVTAKVTEAAKLTEEGSTNAAKATDAALKYWYEKHGPEKVDTKVTDFGCHMQVDILKNNKIVGSLRYQAGNISEL